MLGDKHSYTNTIHVETICEKCEISVISDTKLNKEWTLKLIMKRWISMVSKWSQKGNKTWSLFRKKNFHNTDTTDE